MSYRVVLTAEAKLLLEAIRDRREQKYYFLDWSGCKKILSNKEKVCGEICQTIGVFERWGSVIGLFIGLKMRKFWLLF